MHLNITNLERLVNPSDNTVASILSVRIASLADSIVSFGLPFYVGIRDGMGAPLPAPLKYGLLAAPTGANLACGGPPLVLLKFMAALTLRNPEGSSWLEKRLAGNPDGPKTLAYLKEVAADRGWVWKQIRPVLYWSPLKTGVCYGLGFAFGKVF